MNARERFMAAVRGEPRDRVPIFPLVMRLAADRAGMSYRRYATDGRAMADAQLLVAARYGLDAVTVCSDAFRISADLGGEMMYPEATPPHLTAPLVESADDVARLGRPDPLARGSRMADRTHAVREMVSAARGELAVLGWVDMPFAEACSVCGVQPFMMMLVDAPDLAHRLLDRLTAIVIDFALAQVQAGAHMIGAGDAAASLIAPAGYRAFALPYEQRIIRAIHDAGCLVKLHICGNTTRLLPDMASSGADLFNVDHMVSLEKAREIYVERSASFKGNLDPVTQIMQATRDECFNHAREAIRVGTKDGAAYMLSAGCEVPAETPDEVFEAFCDAACE